MRQITCPRNRLAQLYTTRKQLSSRSPRFTRISTLCTAQQTTLKTKGPVLILPGFLSSSRPYQRLASLLQNRGHPTEVVPLTTSMWLPVLFKGCSFEFYLDLMDEAVVRLCSKHGPVSLVGHSAGGWVARLLLGDIPYQGKIYNRKANVCSLITLGTPHASIENYPFGRVSETLILPDDTAPEGAATSSLQFCNHYYPDVQSLGGHIDVTCIAGNAITGMEFGEVIRTIQNGGRNNSANSNNSSTSVWDAYVAYESYKSGCGRGDVEGDGVTPICISHLPGANNIILQGAWHSPRRKGGELWYGDEAMVNKWESYLIGGRQQTSGSTSTSTSSL